MKKIGWRFRLAILLIILAIIFYFIQYLIFQKPYTELFYIGIDISFIPIEVLVVILVIERAITAKEKEIMLEKMNMVIGAFFSDAGTQLLEMISTFNPDTYKIQNKLLVDFNWEKKDFNSIKEEIKDFEYWINIDKNKAESIEFLVDLKLFLS